MSEQLKVLADKLGISTSYTYFCGGETKCVEVSDELLKFIMADMGYKASSDEEVQKSLARLDKKRWQRAMEAIYVGVVDDINFDIVLKEEECADIKVFVATEGTNSYRKLNVCFSETERRKEGRSVFVKLKGEINANLVPGYYDLKVVTKEKEYHSVLAAAPKECYTFNKKNNKKMFGFALQLYSLRSKRNWGVGDFTDLLDTVDLAASVGADVIGLNPLNVLLHNYPEQASPYASISRLFLNPIYIDVERVPLFSKKDVDEAAIHEAKAKENIDYTAVYQAKIKALHAIFERHKAKPNSAYMKQFMAFEKADEGDLQRLAVFQAICDERFKRGGDLGAKEEAALGSALGKGVEKFAKSHADQVLFFKFLQFEADRQLKEVQKRICDKGLKIGLYRDLPVGVSKNSAEVWGDKYLYFQGSGAGVPPDSYFPTGQKWGLGAFNPVELKERCYKPFIKILRANMRYAGALRIDHIMGLSRLFIIPDEGDEGTYVRYQAKDMMNILALESYLNKCVVVGECIGNVEAGYTESLLKRGIYLLGVLWSERKDAEGTMKTPEEYEEKYFASVGTHDMPPLKAWWFGREIETMHRLGFYTDENKTSAYHWRENERRLLLKALDEAKVWPEDKKRHGDYLFGENFPEGMDEAVHGYMAKSKSEVLLLMPEDVFQSERIQNLPGTDIDKYPNWRAKQVIDLEDVKDSQAWQRHMAIVKKWR